MEATEDALPARMVNEYVYCPRLFWLEHVEGIFADNEHTVRGQHEHRRVDKPGGKLAPPEPGSALPESPPEEQPDGTTASADPDADSAADGTGPDIPAATWHSRSLWLSDEALGVTGRIDFVQEVGDDVMPVDTKKGRSDRGALWPSDRVQLALHALLLRARGYRCTQVAAFYVAERRRVVEPLTDEVIAEARHAVGNAAACARAASPPPPLQDSPKCFGCSLNLVCLPDELRTLPPFRPALPTGDEAIRRVVPLRDDALPLYVQAYNATVGVSGACLKITMPDAEPSVKLVGLPQISHVCIFGTSRITTQALQALMKRDIPVAYFTTRGWLYGLTESAENRQVQVRIAQFACAKTERALDIARRLIADKIANQRTLLRRNADAVSTATLRHLQDAGNRASAASSLELLLGLEGIAAREYWSGYASMFDEEWRPTRRSRRPPEDAINAMLSFGYALLVKDCQLAARYAGLEPHLGVFHTTHHGRPSLALDLMEPFRPLIVDSTVLLMVRRGEVRLSDFVKTGQEVVMKQRARQALINGYERRMDELITHPTFGYRISYRQTIGVHARLISRAFLGEIETIPSIRTR